MNLKLIRQVVYALDVTINEVLIHGLKPELQQSTLAMLGDMSCFIGKPDSKDIAYANQQLNSLASDIEILGDMPLSKQERLLLVQVMATKAFILSNIIKDMLSTPAYTPLEFTLLSELM